MPKMKPFISFIIPAYNEEKYIYDCITSIDEAMKYKNNTYETIVIDNNSTDRTGEIALNAGVNILTHE